MVRKILAVPLLIVGMVFFVQCSDDPWLSDNENVNLKAGKKGGGGGGGGGHTEPVGNNLSFPVFAMDGITITPVTTPSFTEVYTGPYTGLTAEELDILVGSDWFAQKVEGNAWQAEFVNSDGPLEVTFIDWGDVIEAVNPVVGRPFRLETTLYVDISDKPMIGYTMAMLANPSSPNEIQGTNMETYPANWATVASTSPTLIIQFLDAGVDPESPEWNQDLGKWTGEGVLSPLENFSFAPELNVGGKYIYGASSGGWRPMDPGIYRLTFFMSEKTNISFANAVIGNYDGNDPGQWGTPENEVAIVDNVHNLSYVDVTVVTKRR